MGYWSATVTLRDLLPAFLKKNEIYLSTFAGAGDVGFDLPHGGQEVGIRFKILFPTLDTRLYFQFYRGYADSLLRYNQFETAYRAGLSL
jgi:outer membrane phospholipase A